MPRRGRERHRRGLRARLRRSHRGRVAAVSRSDPWREPARRGASLARRESRRRHRRAGLRDTGRREIARDTHAPPSPRAQGRGRDRGSGRGRGLQTRARAPRRAALTGLAALPSPRPRFLALVLVAALPLALATISSVFVVLAALV